MCAKIAVAMSGGVDSSAAALLLKEAGHDLLGLTLRLSPASTPSESLRNPQGMALTQDEFDAQTVAGQLGLPHQVLDMTQTFRDEVIEPFVRAYEAGLTPNPCTLCNRSLKFGSLLKEVQALGCDKLATGHYAVIHYDSGSGRFLLRRAAHPEKDQSYVLYSLTQEQLSRSLFPLGGLSKEDIRAIAADHGLVSAHRTDSQDICFIPDGDYAAFIRRWRGHDYPSGPFVDEDHNVLGVHTGIIHYTVGQRRGLGVSSNHGRLYVKEVQPAENTVVLSENASLFSRTLTADHLNLIPTDRLDGAVKLQAKVRYRMKEQPCTVEQTGPDSIRVTFDQPQRAITPGQSVVLYDGDLVVGGATILKGEP